MTGKTQALLTRIHSERRCGNVFLVVENLPVNGMQDAVCVLDEFTSDHGLGKLGEHWHEVTREFAQAAVSWLLRHDMAYSAELMSRESAKAICQEFMRCFRSDARFYTNLVVDGNDDGVTKTPNEYVSMPLTKATFDAGIAVMDHKSIGILWFEDED